ncbi:hypothetical protein B0T20DRAFT_206260 [Sordaria brevicollis]|uniref:Uncharacterized protein n=1 Tax=Sordaria brevicollis TaxID=83679 RepID=A0AAE0PE66_SORBR|nr:hypothetical protein B0T20DRAFT_206260 [Sordaria brevicollis]
MSRPQTHHISSPPRIYVTSPNRSTFPYNPAPDHTSSVPRSSSNTSSCPSPTTAAAAAAWRTNASELRDVTRDFSAARATSTDAKTKSYTEKEVARFEAMARNAELMAASMAASAAAKSKSEGKAKS